MTSFNTMGKRMIALALGCTLSAPLLAAEFELYGRAHLSVDHLDDGDDGGFNVSSNSSRIGFRASAEINESLTAIMQLEQQVNYENGSGEFATRDSYVGLETDYGTFRLGYFDTPYKLVGSQIDLFRDQIGDIRNLTRTRDNYSGGDYDFETRFRNGIHYRSNTWNDLRFDIHYSTNTDEGSNVDGDNDAVSTSVSYNTSDSYLGLGYERKNETGSSGVRLSGSQVFGKLRLNALLERVTVKGSTLGADQDIDGYGIGASWKLSDATTIKSQYLVLQADTAERDAAMLAIGLDHVLSPSFRILLAWAATDNDDQVRYAMSKGGHGAQVTPLPGETASGFSAGFRFDFQGI